MAVWRSARAKAKARDDAARDNAARAALAMPVEALVVATVDPSAPAPAPVDPVPAPVVAEAEPPSPPPAAVPAVDTQVELLRLFEVVTSMCDHVIEYIEADRAERRLMMDTLAQLGRVITDGAAAAVAAAAQPVGAAPAQPVGAVTPREISLEAPTDAVTDERPKPFAFARRERVIGGSMPAGPEPIIDLTAPAPAPEPEPVAAPEPNDGAPSTSMEIAVEVRGRFGDRWVDGFEICEVMTTPDGPRYRLRRQRDGVVLPELFNATNIRHVETFDQLDGAGIGRSAPGTSARHGANAIGEPLNGATGYWSRS